jgi:hypothetical protein
MLITRSKREVLFSGSSKYVEYMKTSCRVLAYEQSRSVFVVLGKTSSSLWATLGRVTEGSGSARVCQRGMEGQKPGSVWPRWWDVAGLSNDKDSGNALDLSDETMREW